MDKNTSPSDGLSNKTIVAMSLATIFLIIFSQLY